MFIRQYELIVGLPFNFDSFQDRSIQAGSSLLIGAPELDVARGKANTLREYFAESDPNAIVIRDHQINFEITKNGGKNASSNEASVTIHNLSDDLVNYFSNNAGSKLFISLKAGYRDEGMNLIFRGNVIKVKDHIERPGRKTQLFLSDGGTSTKEQLTSRSYRKGTPVDRIINDLISDIDLPRGEVAKLGSEVVTKNQVTLVGTATNNLKKIVESYDMAFNIQDTFVNVIETSVAKIQAQEQSNRQSNVIPFISPSTGLIGDCSYKEDNSSYTLKEAEEKPSNGLEFKTLLMGEITPNSYVAIEDRNFKGTFRVISVSHKGDYEGDEWFTEVVVEDVGLNRKIEAEDNSSVWEQRKSQEIAEYFGEELYDQGEPLPSLLPFQD